jgi:hypothetical protein
VGSWVVMAKAVSVVTRANTNQKHIEWVKGKSRVQSLRL